LLVLIKIEKGGEGLLENHTSKLKIGCIPNNFSFDKNVQGERCMLMHNVTMTRKRKITNNSNNGDFSGSLQESCGIMEFLYVLGKRLGRQSKPCIIHGGNLQHAHSGHSTTHLKIKSYTNGK
jgi:hypothetical protein